MQNDAWWVATVVRHCAIRSNKKSRVPNENGISRLHHMLEIYHSGPKPSKCTGTRRHLLSFRFPPSFVVVVICLFARFCGVLPVCFYMFVYWFRFQFRAGHGTKHALYTFIAPAKYELTTKQSELFWRTSAGQIEKSPKCQDIGTEEDSIHQLNRTAEVTQSLD